MDFSGKVVLITGASSGIGAATAQLFAKRGADLSLTGRNEEALNKVGTECSSLSEKQPLLTTGDLGDEEHVRGLMKATLDNFGRLDVLVNNAGTLDVGSIESPEILKQYDRLFGINVRSVLLLTSLAVPHLAETKGNIVNVSSIAGYRSLAGILAYSMSKSAVDQMTHCTALELAPKQIRVNCVNPGTIVTQIQARAGVDIKEYFDKAKLNHPLGRVGQPEEVASVIVFLASEMASFMTGVTLPVDGGRHCMTPTTISIVAKKEPTGSVDTQQTTQQVKDDTQQKVKDDTQQKVKDDTQQKVEDDTQQKVEDDTQQKVEDDTVQEVEDDVKET